MQLYYVKTKKAGIDVDENGYLKAYGEVQQYPKSEALKKARRFEGTIVKSEMEETGINNGEMMDDILEIMNECAYFGNETTAEAIVDYVRTNL